MLRFGGLLTVVVALTLINGGAKSEMTDKDATVERLHREYPEGGFLIFDVTILCDGKPRICSMMDADLKSADRQTIRVDTRHIPGWIELRPADGNCGGITIHTPGLWKVIGISCGRLTYDGEFGEIQIRSGEIINAGYLILDVHGRAGPTHTENFTPLTLASINLSPSARR